MFHITITLPSGYRISDSCAGCWNLRNHVATLQLAFPSAEITYTYSR